MKAGRSLRTTLLVGVSLCTILTAVLGGVLVYTLFRNQLYRQLDHALVDKLRFLRAACSQVEGRVVFDTEETLWRRIHDPEDPEFFSLRLADGTVLLRSESLEGRDLPEIGRDSFEPVIGVVELPSGKRGHCAGQLFHPERQDEVGGAIAVHVVVAHDSERIETALGSLRGLLLGVGAITTIVLLGATVVIVARNLQPLRTLAGQIEEVSVEDPETRFDLATAPGELEPVIDRLNALMDRVADTIEHERRFTASAAHELRNPLAGIRSQIEVALARPRPAEELRESLEQVREIELRLERVVENLLMLSRLQAGQVRASPVEEVDLGVLLRREWKAHLPQAEDRRLRVKWTCGEGLAPVRSSEANLGMVIRNLFDNAVSYTPEGGAITIEVRGDEGLQVVRIANDNPGLVEDDLALLFQRFWSKSEAREGEHVHAGLGLDLCRRLADALGAELCANIEEGGTMLVFSLRVPEECGQ